MGSRLPSPRDRGAGFLDHWYPIQVKQKDKVGRPDIDAFEAVMTATRWLGWFDIGPANPNLCRTCHGVMGI